PATGRLVILVLLLLVSVAAILWGERDGSWSRSREPDRSREEVLPVMPPTDVENEAKNPGSPI
ncbi:MAG TPA: hypothetical protein VLH10_00255, partial [Yinghuangia sp.]|nr:hypothetical protein [Yinghuangia sp.]